MGSAVARYAVPPDRGKVGYGATNDRTVPAMRASPNGHGRMRFSPRRSARFVRGKVGPRICASALRRTRTEKGRVLSHADRPRDDRTSGVVVVPGTTKGPAQRGAVLMSRRHESRARRRSEIGSSDFTQSPKARDARTSGRDSGAIPIKRREFRRTTPDDDGIPTPLGSRHDRPGRKTIQREASRPAASTARRAAEAVPADGRSRTQELWLILPLL